MKLLLLFFHKKPWLFFILAFIILISAWSVFIILSLSVPSKRLTTQEEARLLEGTSAR